MIDYVKLDPPETIIVAEKNQLHCVGKSTQLVPATDQDRKTRSFRLPAEIVP